MSTDDQIDLHSDRALEELDRAHDATCKASARAHLTLSELHFDRARELSKEPLSPPALRLVGS
jgi:hypothetical protein